jgi:signal transduction histidine kinase
VSYLSFQTWIGKVKDNQLELEALVEQRTQEIKRQKEQIEEKQKEINKQYGTLMEQQAELVLANATKNRLLSVVSDDVGSALNILRYQLDSLDSRVKNVESKEIKPIIEEMGKNLKHTTVLLQNLLYWSLEQLHHTTPFFVAINLWQMIEENVEFFRALARSNGITLHNQISREIEVLADINILNLAIRDLLSTTIKFTSKGVISISADIKNDAMISTSIHLSESNLTNEQIGNLLNKFSTEDTLTLNLEKDTSLGLRIARDYIAKMGGQVTIKGHTGKGFAIDFTLHKA